MICLVYESTEKHKASPRSLISQYSKETEMRIDKYAITERLSLNNDEANPAIILLEFSIYIILLDSFMHVNLCCIYTFTLPYKIIIFFFKGNAS